MAEKKPNIIKKYKSLPRSKRNIISLAAVLVLVLVIALVALSSKSSTLKQDFNIENSEDITKVIINDKAGRTMTLEKQSDSVWTVNSKYEANRILVNTLINTFKDMRIREPLPKAARNNIVKNLATNGKKVEVYAREYFINWGFVKLFKRNHLKCTYYVGHETQDEMGTYMLRKGDKEPYVIYIPNFMGYLSTRFNAVEDLWRSHNIFRYRQSEIASIDITLPDEKNESFTLVNNGKGYSFINNAGVNIPNFDTSKVVALLSSFVEMNYERAAKNIAKVEKDTIFSHNPQFVITVKDKKGKKNTLKTYVKLADPASIAEGDDDFYHIFDINRCYAISDKMKDTLIFQYFTLDNVLHPASYFLKK